MATPVFLSISDQVAAHVRAEIVRGRWQGELPGRNALAEELGVNAKTVEEALRVLERAEVLVSRGSGLRRGINPGHGGTTRRLRIGWLEDNSIKGMQADYEVEMFHRLTEQGHVVVQAEKSMAELSFAVDRIAALVKRTAADAWIVGAGSRPVLEWFAAQSVPAFALFGQRSGLRMPAVGPDKPPAMIEATRSLVAQGHRRIVLLCRKLRRLPKPGTSEQAFLDTLEAGGVQSSRYNLPDWEESVEGFQNVLESLFLVTPPSALIVDEAMYFVAVMQFLLRRGIRVPDDVSLVCTDDDLVFSHCDPPVSRIVWDSAPVVRRVLRWAANVSRHRQDFRQTLTPARYLAGGTVAPCAQRGGA